LVMPQSGKILTAKFAKKDCKSEETVGTWALQRLKKFAKVGKRNANLTA